MPSGPPNRPSCSSPSETQRIVRRAEAEHGAIDATTGVKNPKPPPKGDGFAAWTEDDVAAYENHWPDGMKERVWLHVLLYTGLHRGNAVNPLGMGIASLKTEKTGTEINITILPELADTLAAGPTGAFIIGDNGQPLTKETFGNCFRFACNAAGVNNSAHGVRNIDATREANAGATVAEQEAQFGWTGGTTRAKPKRQIRNGSRGRLQRGSRRETPLPSTGNPRTSKTTNDIKALVRLETRLVRSRCTRTQLPH